ncbi:DNA methyltransferase [Ornithobacterium rhinotracheale]|uniref:DNA methyltransferase n=1 Tax=Ornithobacterium rhinotracheale TaxID=28251 RepID=UPI003FA4AB71
MKNSQVKSRQRVADHGEVFTNKREVKAMLDLVKDQCERIEATFLEPACGDGNFLIEILRRKLQLLEKYKRQADAYNKHLVVAVSSIYGVELLEDNAQDCRERLYQEIVKRYPKSLQSLPEYNELMLSLRFVLQKNIICGNALDYTKADGSPIIFYEWKFISDTQVKIRCFDFEVVAEESKQTSLFDELMQPASLPQHDQEFPPIHYLKLYTYADK